MLPLRMEKEEALRLANVTSATTATNNAGDDDEIITYQEGGAQTRGGIAWYFMLIETTLSRNFS